jgi:CHAT domain-containing protein/tetratricopeptide (TPR) repeat protein
MSSSRDDYDNIREYLLGQLTDKDREEFERRLFVDDELFEKLQTAEDDLVDDFLTGDLSHDDVAMFHKNFLIGTKRKQKLRIGKAWRNYAAAHAGEKPPRPVPVPAWHWWQLVSSYPLRIATIAAVIFAAAIGFLRSPLFQSGIDEGLLALDDAYRQERPLESRITRLSYAPFTATSTRGRGSSSVNEGERDQAELELHALVTKKPTPAAHHALGKVYLAKKEFDKAIAQFEEARKGDPNNAQIYADLGAALFEKGKLEIEKARTNSDSAESGKGMEYFARSLENLNKALELDNKVLEALFNRALLHQAMGLLPQAEEDWRKYLENDPNSKWADEVRQRLESIEQQRKKTSVNKEEIFQKFLSDFDSSNEDGVWTTFSSYQNRTGNVVVEQLIDAYLVAAAQNQIEDAAHAMQRLSYLGNLQVRKNEDRFFFDLARFYESTTSEQRNLVVKARELMKGGYAGWIQVEMEENLSLFGNARELFEQAGDHPEAKVAEYWMSFCRFHQHKPQLSQQLLDPLLSVCENRNYIWLQVRSLYLRSAIEFELNEHSKAVDLGLQAVRIAEQTNDSVGQLNAMSALIEYYRYLGNYPKSLACIQRSLTLVTSTALDPIQGTRHYSLAAMAFATTGLHDAAADYQREASRFAFSTGSDAIKSQNYAFLGNIYGKLKNFGEALKNIQLASRFAESDSNGPVGRGLMAYSSLQMGNVYRDAGEFEKAIAKYTQSIDLYNTFSDFQIHLFQAHKGKLLCYVRQQNDASTQEEISILLGLMEKYRSKISDESHRNTFFDVEQSVIEVAIDFEYSRMKNPERAFSYSNSSRARSLLDLLNADKGVKAKIENPDIKFQAVSEPRPLKKIVKQLPDQTLLLQYDILEDKLLIWVISKNDFQVRMQPISRKDLNEKLLRYLNIVSRPPKDEDEPQELLLAKDLYAILIRPVAQLLDKGKLLCIIPDGTLNYLPFAALVSPESSKYLFEEHLLMTSPSASVFLRCSKNALRNGRPRVEKILSVGNPTFDRTAFPNLDNLPAASREAAEVSRVYKLAVPLTENKATKTAVKSEVERSDVIHLALHSNVDSEVPLLSRLLLAKTNADTLNTGAFDQIWPSVIYAYEIYNLRLSRTRLVVLSSCETGSGRYYGGEGVSSLARAFIGAGVPLVVASLWPVESTATEKLMVSFHRHRALEGVRTVEALRSAQQDMMRAPAENLRRPYYWAAFSVTGGYATF